LIVGRNKGSAAALFRIIVTDRKRHVTFKPYKQKKGFRILSHILFWLFILGFFTFIFGIRKGEGYLKLVQLLIGTLPVDILFTYFILYFLIPRFLLQRRYIHFFLLLFTTFSIVVIIEWTINFYVMYPWVYSDWEKWKSSMHYLSGEAFGLYLSIGFVVLLASAIKLVKQWYESQQSKAELEIQNRKSELALLRSQVNPHFLFNTLNNIDALIRKDPEKASDSVMKLSEIMRYFIYEANTDKVPLQKEVDYLESFIELQRLRYKNADFISYKKSGQAGGAVIAPMLFVPFVENAFKHGTRRSLAPGISIELGIMPGRIRLEVWNYFEGNGNGNNHIGPGIGLANVERRLKMIYPDRHRLEIQKQEDRFIITLEMETE
jgi:two-component system, LytTR family, sensor kinase